MLYVNLIRSMYLAASLLHLGLSRGQRVLLAGQTSIPYMVFSMALHRIGCNSILLGPGALTQDKVDLLKTLDCKVIIYDAKMKESQKKQLVEGIAQLHQHNADNNMKKQVVISLGSVDVESGNDDWHSYENLLESGQSGSLEKVQEAQNEVQFGSTGTPKIVQSTSHSMLSYFSGSPLSSPEMPPQTVYIDRPFSWISGHIFCQIGICSNLTPVCVPTEIGLFTTTSVSVFEIWEREKCTFCVLNTALIHKLYSEKMHLKYSFNHIKCFILAGQRFTREHFARLFGCFPDAKILLAYASSESPAISSESMGKECLQWDNIGKMSISSGVEIKVVDIEEKVVPRGIAGEICIRNSSVYLEYMGNTEATKRAKAPTGWFRSGDTGIMHDDGKIEVLGRKTEMIKRGISVKIFPAEIEKVISQHPCVSDVVVVGIPDQRLHEEMCACVVLKNAEDGSSDEKTRLQELEDWCRDQWPPGPDGLSLKPKYYLAIKSFPHTSTGKVFRREMKDEAQKRLGTILK